MDKVYQVFVSSTFADLELERRQVTDALAKAGYVVAGMELFPAADQQQFDFIKRVIDRSDYYVVIVAGRYGSVAEDGISFTEKEFEYARSKRIPILAFIHGEPNRIEVGKTDQDVEQTKKLEAFRSKLRDGRLVEFWTETGDLCTKIIIAISYATNLTPGIGWVRGDQAADPKVLQEAAKLRIANAELRKRLEVIEGAEIVFDPKLIGPDDYIEFSVRILTPQQDINARKNVHVEAVKATIGEIFIAIYDHLLSEPSESHLQKILGYALSVRISNPPVEAQYDIDKGEVIRLRHHLEALDLIEAFGDSSTSTFGPYPMKHDYVAWRPSEKGRRFFIRKKAVRRKEPSTSSDRRDNSD